MNSSLFIVNSAPYLPTEPLDCNKLTRDSESGEITPLNLGLPLDNEQDGITVTVECLSCKNKLKEDASKEAVELGQKF